jgi:hypothetical protein
MGTFTSKFVEDGLLANCPGGCYFGCYFTSPCSVTPKGLTVTSISYPDEIAGYTFYGTIPPQIGQMTALRSMYVIGDACVPCIVGVRVCCYSESPRVLLRSDLRPFCFRQRVSCCLLSCSSRISRTSCASSSMSVLISTPRTSPETSRTMRALAE